MKKVLLIPLLLTILVLVACPKPENNARDGIAGAKGFIDSVATAHPECTTNPALQVCVLVYKANAAKHSAIDALNVYCSSPDYDNNGGTCSPPTDKTQKNQLQNKLNASLQDLNQIITDLKALK